LALFLFVGCSSSKKVANSELTKPIRSEDFNKSIVSDDANLSMQRDLKTAVSSKDNR
jgi:uncharacterized protein YcfL